MNVIAEIQQDIEELKELIGTQNLDRKLELAERVANNSWRFAQLTADAYEDANTSEYLYKSRVNTAMVNGEGSQAAREAAAKEQYRELYKEVIQKQNLLKRYTLLLNQTQVVLDQCRQTISHLKQERKSV